MKRTLSLTLLTLTIGAGLLPPAQAQMWVPTAGEAAAVGEPAWTVPFGTLSLGIRAVYRTLDGDKRWPQDGDGNGQISADEVLAVSFMGSITELDVDQVYWPNLPYVQWAFTPCWGVEASWEHYRVDTGRWTGGTHGTFVISGPALSVYGRLRTGTRLTPYAQLGLLWLDIDFEADPLWHLAADQAGYDAYLAAGSPATWNDGERQHLDPDSDLGALLMAGCELRVTQHVYVELFLRYAYLEAYARRYNTRLFFDDAHPNGERRVSSDQGSFEFPLETFGLGTGVRYEF